MTCFKKPMLMSFFASQTATPMESDVGEEASNEAVNETRRLMLFLHLMDAQLLPQWSAFSH